PARRRVPSGLASRSAPRISRRRSPVGRTRPSAQWLVGLSRRVGGVFGEIRVHVIPGLGAVDENVGLRPKPARVVERADPDADQIGPRRNPQEQHAAAFGTEPPGYLIA